jgi:hypothetical protein
MDKQTCARKECGETFKPKRAYPVQRYCSYECGNLARVRAYRQNHAPPPTQHQPAQAAE